MQVIESFSALHLVMECASNSDLQDRVMNDGPYKEDMAQHIFSQIAAAINHMVNCVRRSFNFTTCKQYTRRVNPTLYKFRGDWSHISQ